MMISQKAPRVPLRNTITTIPHFLYMYLVQERNEQTRGYSLSNHLAIHALLFRANNVTGLNQQHQYTSGKQTHEISIICSANPYFFFLVFFHSKIIKIKLPFLLF